MIITPKTTTYMAKFDDDNFMITLPRDTSLTLEAYRFIQIQYTVILQGMSITKCLVGIGYQNLFRAQPNICCTMYSIPRMRAAAWHLYVPH